MSKSVSFTHGSAITVDNLPDKCPFCHNKITPTIIGTNTFQSPSAGGIARMIFHCPDSDCGEVFIGYFTPNPPPNSNKVFKLNRTSIGNNVKKQFHESVKEVSENFIEIYNQAYQAEQYDLKDICGVGYRKALEFLIKDFCKKYNVEKEEEIKRLQLAQVIEKFIEDNKIKQVAKRAVWLGNDETHYVRKWEAKDLNDLKMTIDLTLTFIQSKYDYDKLMESMPDTK
ncbi:MAG: DUF4145 domain-containing protein [Bacteroidota bacterium]